ncbi:1-acyl-sn-glycerol-3-phosphate acyltransferase [Fischerella thermalis]|uniref:1-acyl-sn-glycerol-3-phosphate acyltransferase n=1 Tax=Fischerella thermalis TaxID=372787 RepID=UPI000C80C71B|nr:1-acyl-sn-glycerol-3-phosphate acyltransferase [Fischerella thermalis]MBF1989369.1 1-acyl-sn-glycerol-3-phosphate acyltransferase [Fischerella thermalis M58_A2018_009]MBF2061817.1 1-acyl-sn-glycerol-3-phosphate acyltransferase [Fischerella thermalis M66_A2018_004]MBF2068635.1 1-acyl-sn-glycerol-3-phosphate acyltransferase [Fischerella thermalis M48_A2018_028]PLZ88595.1 glycerol acyltransferase [Fischerella thermalis CCMEE 5194]
MQHAQSRLEFIPQRFNPVVLRLAQWLLPILLRFRLRPWLPAGISRIQVKNAEILAELYQQFQAGKVRFLMAFRHPEVDDPLCMLYLLSRAVPRVARQQGILLQYPIHSHFIYERGMLLWAGDWLGWFFSNLGGIPIRRGKRLDKLGIQNARNLFANAKMPIAVAPEGATNGHSGIVSPLEPGVAQFGFWCVEDLQKANRSEEVLIVPIALQYSYVKPPWAKLDWLLSKLEADCGLPVKTIGRSETANPEEIHYPRLLRLAEHLLTEMEGFYQRFYHQHLAAIDHELEARGNANEILMARLHRLQDTALKVAEQYFKLQPQGNFIDRCRRLEEAGWSYIYREDVSDINALPPFQRGLADWVAAEAELRMRHMRLVETFIAVTGTYVKEKPTPERFAETALLIFDMIARTRNNTKLPGRPRLGWRQALITVGQPISVTERWAKSQSDRRAVRVGVTELTKELHQALEQLIKT